jgi:hypothetical protein
VAVRTTVYAYEHMEIEIRRRVAGLAFVQTGLQVV